MRPLIRFATAADHVVLEDLERAADLILIERFGARSWPPPTSNEEPQDAPGFVLVAALPSPGDEHADVPSTPIGFAQVLEVDGEAHLEQLSVHPEHARHGIGRALVMAAQDESRRRGRTQLTLRTYADVPWNAPFYSRCGFVESTPDTDFLRELVAVEERLGLTRYGRRIQMTAAL